MSHVCLWLLCRESLAFGLYQELVRSRKERHPQDNDRVGGLAVGLADRETREKESHDKSLVEANH